MAIDSSVVNNVVKFDVLCPKEDVSSICIVQMNILCLEKIDNDIVLTYYYVCDSCGDSHRAILFRRKFNK